MSINVIVAVIININFYNDFYITNNFSKVDDLSLDQTYSNLLVIFTHCHYDNMRF